MKTDVFFDTFTQKLAMIRLTTGGLPAVKSEKVNGVVDGFVYTLEFEDGKVFQFWIGLTLVKVRISIHYYSKLSVKSIFDKLKNSLADVLALGWTFQIGNQVIENNSFDTINAQLNIDQDLKPELGSCLATETAYFFQLLLPLVADVEMLVPGSELPLPGRYLALTDSLAYPLV